MEVIVITIM